MRATSSRVVPDWASSSGRSRLRTRYSGTRTPAKGRAARQTRGWHQGCSFAAHPGLRQPHIIDEIGRLAVPNHAGEMCAHSFSLGNRNKRRLDLNLRSRAGQGPFGAIGCLFGGGVDQLHSWDARAQGHQPRRHLVQSSALVGTGPWSKSNGLRPHGASPSFGPRPRSQPTLVKFAASYSTCRTRTSTNLLPPVCLRLQRRASLRTDNHRTGFGSKVTRRLGWTGRGSEKHVANLGLFVTREQNVCRLLHVCAPMDLGCGAIAFHNEIFQATV